MARILLVEDERNIRLFIGFNLQRFSHHVFEAVDGIEASQILQNEPIDVVITDLLMPRMDGLDLIDFIQHDYRHIPIIAISAREDELLQAKKKGAVIVLTKPFSYYAIIEALNRILSKNFSQP